MMTVMVMLIITILGVVSITKMKMALTPDVEMSMVMIMTNYPDAGPEEVESLVTEKIHNDFHIFRRQFKGYA